MEQIFGFVERIVFCNSENGFTVLRLKQVKKTDLTTVVGTFPFVQPGETVRLVGEWKTNVHGVQFEAQECHVERPSDPVGIQKYLESGQIRGIGPVYAQKIVKQFGEKTLEILDERPAALLKIDGIGPKKLETIKKCWQEHKTIRHVMLFLQKYGVSPNFARKIFKIYGEGAVEKIQENPYALAREIRGVGFKTADSIAEKIGFPRDSTQRIDAGIEHVLLELADEGHTCFPLEEFCKQANEMLQADVHARIQALLTEERIVLDNGFIWLKGFWICEQGITQELRRLCSHQSHLRAVDSEKALLWVEDKLKMKLAENQKKAVARSLVEKMHIITGGPGTGKSTITKAILSITEKLTRRIILAAPTGRAAKRLNEITKRQAFTIHSLLQYDFVEKGFRRNRENPLSCDLLIVDESSMIDTHLMYHLLRAVPDHARVIFVGDMHQLPSVGPGNVLKDLIESAKIFVTELKEIFRQAAGSKIILNAHRINEGQFPDLKIEKNVDFFFMKATEPQEALEKIVLLVSERLPKRYRLDPIDDIQVLSPMRKGILGIDHLNTVLQKKLNFQKDSYRHGATLFGIHDKVMQLRNNYNKEVFNGDIGRILRINQEEHELTVSFDGKEVIYAFSELDELVLAYATSIHKSQGSEYRCVVIPIHTTHFTMLHRNLLYTAVTRGKKLVVLVGTGKALAIAVSTDNLKKRHTGLKQFLHLQEALVQ